MFYPPDYQLRLEEGAEVLRRVSSSSEWEHLVSRLRRGNSLSAEEELLLARGFALEFGTENIVRPNLPTNAPRPEFALRVYGKEIFVEAKGQLDSETVQRLNRQAMETGQGGWFSHDPKIADPNRIINAVRDKILKNHPNQPTILVFTQYAAHHERDVVADTLRRMAQTPDEFGIPRDRRAIATVYVFERLLQGIWFSTHTLVEHSVEASFCDRLRRALLGAFYPRPDGILLN